MDAPRRADARPMVRRALVLALLALVAVPAVAAATHPAHPAASRSALVTASLAGNRHVTLGLAGRPVDWAYEQAVGRRPVIFQSFTRFGLDPAYAFKRAAALHAVPMVHISTAGGNGLPGSITPRAIARGGGDHWLLTLQRDIAATGGLVYVRPMAEMDAYWNAYSAYGPGGRRGAAYSTTWFKRAWKRIAVILRGGTGVDAKLRALHLPVTGRGSLPPARVSLIWCPQVAGAPDVAGNAPRAYWPGGKWVDWVGTDFYSKFPNFAGLERFYDEFRGKPFAFGEWALWDRDDPAFVHRFFAWVRSHPRVHMIVYNQGANPGGPFDLARFPASRRALRSETAGPRFH
jgi:hypothetical protein